MYKILKERVRGYARWHEKIPKAFMKAREKGPHLNRKPNTSVSTTKQKPDDNDLFIRHLALSKCSRSLAASPG